MSTVMEKIIKMMNEADIGKGGGGFSSSAGGSSSGGFSSGASSPNDSPPAAASTAAAGNSRIFALLRQEGGGSSGPMMTSSSCFIPGNWDMGGGTRKTSPTIFYDRDFLFSCADSPIAQRMPKALEHKLEDFPLMKRKIGSPSSSDESSSVVYSPRQHQHYHHHYYNNNDRDHFRLFEPQPSVVDSLPLRPTAQIYTWDPQMELWVPRSRPQES